MNPEGVGAPGAGPCSVPYSLSLSWLHSHHICFLGAKESMAANTPKYQFLPFHPQRGAHFPSPFWLETSPERPLGGPVRGVWPPGPTERGPWRGGGARARAWSDVCAWRRGPGKGYLRAAGVPGDLGRAPTWGWRSRLPHVDYKADRASSKGRQEEMEMQLKDGVVSWASPLSLLSYSFMHSFIHSSNKQLLKKSTLSLALEQSSEDTVTTRQKCSCLGGMGRAGGGGPCVNRPPTTDLVKMDSTGGMEEVRRVWGAQGGVERATQLAIRTRSHRAHPAGRNPV